MPKMGVARKEYPVCNWATICTESVEYYGIETPPQPGPSKRLANCEQSPTALVLRISLVCAGRYHSFVRPE